MNALAATVVPANPSVIDFIYPTLSALTVLLLGYIARKVAIGVRKFRTQHDWLMETAKEHGEQIAENTAAIKRMLEQRERLLDERQAPGPRRR